MERYIRKRKRKMFRIKKFDQFIFESEGSKSGSLVVPVGGTFQSGKFQISNTKPLDDKMPEITAFLNKYPKNQRMEVTVEAMESQVPNKGVGLKPGELAQKRTDAMVNLLVEKLKDFKNVIITSKKPEIGPTPWKPEAGDKFDDEKFTKEQRVDIVIKPFGEIIEAPKEEDEYSFSVNFDGVPGGKSETAWSDARLGTWGFTVKGLDNAKKVYDFLKNPNGNMDKDSIWKREENGKLKDPKGRFFNASHFEKYDSKEKFDAFFKEVGSKVNWIEEMPNHFFLYPAAKKFAENGLRPIWKSGAKDKTL